MKKRKLKGISRTGIQKDYRFRDYVRYVFLYSILFCIVSFVVFYPFLQEEKCLIWKIDGMPQYMLWLQYTGEYIREGIKSFLHGNFKLPLYDFSIGMGGDVRSFLKTEPVGFLGVFLLQRRWTWEIFSLLTIFRLYLSGLSFSCYGFYKKCNQVSVMAGSFVYAFSMYSFFQVVRHPQFAVPVIMLPLLFIGIEQVMKKQNMLFYSLMVAISLLSSYYFLYMNTILMGIYVLIRLPEIYDKNRIKEFFGILGRIIVSYLLGCGMAIVTFVPSIASFFLSARGVAGNSGISESLWTYGDSRVWDLLKELIIPIQTAGGLTTITVSIIIVPAIAALLTRKWKEKLSAKIALFLSILFLMVPVFGYIFSGFSAINNRWCYAVVFLMAVIVMFELERLAEIPWISLILAAGFTGVYMYVWRVVSPDQRQFKYMITELIAVLGLLLLCRLAPMIKKEFAMKVLCLVTLASVALNGYMTFVPSQRNMVSEFQSRHSANNYFTESRYRYLTQIEDDSFYRTDTDMMFNNYNNTSVALNYNGISLYNSTIAGSTIQYFKESESVGISAINRTLSLDNRTSQEALACVKYYITEKGNPQNVPYGFAKDDNLAKNSETYDMYTNQYILPIGYTYTSYMTRSDYDALPAIEKQEAAVEHVIIEDQDVWAVGSMDKENGETGDVSQGTISITGVDEGITENEPQVYSVPDKMKVEKQMIDGKEVEVDVSPKIHFKTQSKEGCEVYLRLKGLTFSRSVRTDFNVYIDGVDKRAIVRSALDTYGLGMQDYLVNLGYFEETKDIEGSFSMANRGTFRVEDYEVYYVRMSDYAEEIEELKKDSLTDIKVEDGKVEGKVQLPREEFLAFSIPYHIGWEAYVDGQKVKVFRANTMYLGIPVGEGEHDIRLVYTSPGMKIGAVVSGLCILIYLILFLKWRGRRRKIKKSKK